MIRLAASCESNRNLLEFLEMCTLVNFLFPEKFVTDSPEPPEPDFRYLTMETTSILRAPNLLITIKRVMVALEALDGSTVKPGTYGRGQHGLTDPKISRQQFSISESALDTLTLRNLGQNRKPGSRVRRLIVPISRRMLITRRSGS